jgi:hypothetical protein
MIIHRKDHEGRDREIHIPTYAVATETSLPKCSACIASWENKREEPLWCRLLRICLTCPGPQDPFSPTEQTKTNNPNHLLNIRVNSLEEELYPKKREG